MKPETHERSGMATSPRRISACARRLSRWSLQELSSSFPVLQKALSSIDIEFRERLFSPVVTFWMFLSQVLSDNASCQEMVAKALAALWLTEAKQASADNSAYCQARKRLPEFLLQRLAEQTAADLECRVSAGQLWRGRQVKIVDGSSLSMPDTGANQSAYPQPDSQKPGCGFPVMRLVVVFSLATGVILRLASGRLRQSERALLQCLIEIFLPGEILLADRGFCSFADIYMLMTRGVDAVLRQHANRSAGVRCKRRLGSGDRLVEWLLSNRIPPAWMDPKTWHEMPETLTLREITYTVPVKGFRSKRIVLVTTLTDAKLFPRQAFADLYLQRWEAELFLRDIKICLHMDVLRCKTPEMIHKELWMHVIAYNLIRTLMWTAAQRHHVCPSSISFRSSLASIRQWALWLAAMDPRSHRFSKTRDILLAYISQHLVPYRPNRVEPRARKRRPKIYHLLTAPRKVFKEIHHANRYRKGA